MFQQTGDTPQLIDPSSVVAIANPAVARQPSNGETKMNTGPYTYKVILLGFNPHSLSRDRVTSFLNQSPISRNWITILPGQLFFLATVSIMDAATILRAQFPDEFIFVAEVNQYTCDGWLPKDVWDFINNPSDAKAPNYLEMLSQLPKPR